MKTRYKRYLKLNFISIIFIAVSFMSVTLAWFAYTGLNKVSTEVNVKAWYIELEQDGESVSNDIVISLSDIYPGMEIVDELINIKNSGDSDASIKYEITSARILGYEADEYIVSDSGYTTEYVEDVISHEYPFKINVDLEQGYVLAGGDESTFEVSLSWPLDSGEDEIDSYWGTEAYKFQQSEADQLSLDPEYQVQSSIKIVISVTAEQYLSEDDVSDYNYNLGDTILYDVVNDVSCESISSTCIKTTVIDVDNKIGDDYVSVMTSPIDADSQSTYTNYATNYTALTSTWSVINRELTAEDILNIISTDIVNSTLVRSGLSDSIIGNLDYTNRYTTEIAKAINDTGYYNFITDDFSYLSSNICYWTNTTYDASDTFAVKNNGDNTNLYAELNSTSCKVVSVIDILKENLD